ncbi:helix-turn-helix transcriptional regulator [Bradyrhizobium sp. BR 1432]|uniref:helix-turn-helix transcriptional regulator n=1 Tax=Bradyrhizobium sp. BR 1432 TaxID=3447966 RepID=UPI003EE5A357
MNRPIFEQPTEREFLLAQLSPDDRRRVRDFMRENRIAASDAIQMLGIGQPDVDRSTPGIEVSDDERQFMLSQLPPNERAWVERALARNREITVGRCMAQIRKAAEPRQMAVGKLPLSPCEKQLLRRLAAGKTDAQIAKRLGGTAKQVGQQRARLLAKLGLSAPHEIVDAAERLANWRTYRGVT